MAGNANTVFGDQVINDEYIFKTRQNEMALDIH